MLANRYGTPPGEDAEDSDVSEEPMILSARDHPSNKRRSKKRNPKKKNSRRPRKLEDNPVEEVTRPGLRNLKNFVYFNRRFNSSGTPSDYYPGNTYRSDRTPSGYDELPKDLLRNNPYSGD